MPQNPTPGTADPASVEAAQGGADWWREAVVYEVYPRSFSDANGDGDGDLAGVVSRLGYLSSLGVDAIWIAPWFPSPLADGGYDITDYRDIHPLYGTLADAVSLISAAHDHGIRVIIDMVANHTSEQHPWFRAALRTPPGSRERERYFFRRGRGEGGELPPNNWISAFGGSAWSRSAWPDGAPGEWYLHTFAPEQPDLNWGNAEVREEFEDILRFWFDRGVDGIRVDAAPAFAKRPDLPDADYGGESLFLAADWVDNPHWDVAEVHAILRRWRAVGEAYRDRMFVAEAVVSSPERLSAYLRADEMHSAFNFQFLKAPWDEGLREVIAESLAALADTGAPATWVLASHDETRLVTRYGRARTGSRHIADDQGAPWDRELGTRRARAAALLVLALPGGVYLYQGEELGLPEVEDIPEHLLADPMWRRSGHTIRGRDGCRVPLPWSGEVLPYGFSAGPGPTWLPQPADWAGLTVSAQLRDPGSMLALYTAALRVRKECPGFRGGTLRWRESAAGVLDFERGAGLRCVLNFGPAPLELDPAARVLLASAPLPTGLLPADACVWLSEAARV
ncbi:MAG: glycoside hydrolase family 13 protein [Candidatus Nanopelagicales bacterium]